MKLKEILLLFLVFAVVGARGQKETLIVQTPHNNTVQQIYYSVDGKLLYTLSQGDNQIKIWDSRIGKLLKNVEIISAYKEFYFYQIDNNVFHLIYTEKVLHFLGKEIH